MIYTMCLYGAIGAIGFLGVIGLFGYEESLEDWAFILALIGLAIATKPAKKDSQ